MTEVLFLLLAEYFYNLCTLLWGWKFHQAYTQTVGVDNRNLKKGNQEGIGITRKLIIRELINIFDAEKSDRPEFETKMSECEHTCIVLF